MVTSEGFQFYFCPSSLICAVSMKEAGYAHVSANFPICEVGVFQVNILA